jgi:hypothetical protein
MHAMCDYSGFASPEGFYKQHVNAPVIAGESPQRWAARFVTTGRGLVPESTAGAQNKTLILFKEVILLDT